MLFSGYLVGPGFVDMIWSLFVISGLVRCKDAQVMCESS